MSLMAAVQTSSQLSCREVMQPGSPEVTSQVPLGEPLVCLLFGVWPNFQRLADFLSCRHFLIILNIHVN